MKINSHILHTPENPFSHTNAIQSFEDGFLKWDENTGVIEDLGSGKSENFKEDCIKTEDCLLVPGFIDLHTHYPQTLAIASSGKDLMTWLNSSIYPAESRLQNDEHAEKTAAYFINKLLASGTTTAFVYGSQFLRPNQILFSMAEKKGIDLVTGMTLMDRFAPETLLQPFDCLVEANERLFTDSLSNDRISYCTTPRFAISCTPELLSYAGEFAEKNGTWIQTHINETTAEIKAAHSLFPNEPNYLGIYEKYNLLTPRTILAHSIHSSPKEMESMNKSGCHIAHCPSSNFFLGSGVFPMQQHLEHGVNFGLGTDVGAGTQFSMLRELGDSYKSQQLLGTTLSGGQLLYLATRAGANALGNPHLGHLKPGSKADFILFSWEQDPYLKERVQHCKSLEELFFILVFIAGKRHVKAVYKNGVQVFPFSN